MLNSRFGEGSAPIWQSVLMFPSRSRPKIPPIFYLYLIAVIAMTALAASRIAPAAQSSPVQGIISLDQKRP
jgi:hypothetical protein